MTNRNPCNVRFVGSHLEKWDYKICPIGVQTLDLSGNLLTTLPDGMHRFQKLLEVNLEDNDIRTLRCDELAQVAVLNLSKNEHVASPDADAEESGLLANLALPNCHTLKLRKCKITGLPLPKTLAVNLASLRSIDLSHNHITDSSASALAHCLNLRTVLLANNDLEHGSALAFKSKYLTHLSLSHNHLEDFQDAFGLPRSLEFLDVSSNKLVLLPEDISNLHNLKTLLCQHNRLTALPDMSRLSLLTLLNIGTNELQAIDDDLILGKRGLCITGASINPLLLSRVSRECLASSATISRHRSFGSASECARCKHSPISRLLAHVEGLKGDDSGRGSGAGLGLGLGVGGKAVVDGNEGDLDLDLELAIGNDMLALYSSGEGSDCRFEFAKGGSPFFIHKAVIKARCPRLLDMDRVPVSDSVAESFFSFVYSGGSPILGGSGFELSLRKGRMRQPRTPPPPPPQPDVQNPAVARRRHEEMRAKTFALTPVQAAKPYKLHDKDLIGDRGQSRRRKEEYAVMMGIEARTERLNALHNLGEMLGMDLLCEWCTSEKLHLALVFLEWKTAPGSSTTPHQLSSEVQKKIDDRRSHFTSRARHQFAEDIGKMHAGVEPDFEIRIPVQVSASASGSRSEGGIDINEPEHHVVSLPVHEAVIAARCEFFGGMARCNMIEMKKRSVTLHDVDSESIKLMLDFIYARENLRCGNVSIEALFNLLDVADRFGFAVLTKAAERSILAMLREGTGEGSGSGSGSSNSNRNCKTPDTLLLTVLELACKFSCIDLVITTLCILAPHTAWKEYVSQPTIQFVDDLLAPTPRLASCEVGVE